MTITVTNIPQTVITKLAEVRGFGCRTCIYPGSTPDTVDVIRYRAGKRTKTVEPRSKWAKHLTK